MRLKPLNVIRKLAAGVFLIALAALFSFLLKETLDSNDPENNLPILTVSCGYATTLTNGNGTAETYIKRAGYEWNFLTKIVKSPTLPPTEYPLYPVTVAANTPILISFSVPCQSLKVSRSNNGQYDPNFETLNGEITTPSAPGDYCYCIEAGFARGSIIYYFVVRISD